MCFRCCRQTHRLSTLPLCSTDDGPLPPGPAGPRGSAPRPQRRGETPARVRHLKGEADRAQTVVYRVAEAVARGAARGDVGGRAGLPYASAAHAVGGLQEELSVAVLSAELSASSQLPTRAAELAAVRCACWPKCRRSRPSRRRCAQVATAESATAVLKTEAVVVAPSLDEFECDDESF